MSQDRESSPSPHSLGHVQLLQEIGVALFEEIPEDHKDDDWYHFRMQYARLQKIT